VCTLITDMVQRKTLVLDLDETLIHSHHDGVLRQTVKPGTPPDFVLKVGTETISLWKVLFSNSCNESGAKDW